MTHDQIPPAALDSESTVLGSLLVDRTLIAGMAQVLGPDDFHDPRHGWIFSAIVALDDAGKPLDKIAVAQELRERGNLEKCGGPSYLSALMDTVQTASSAMYHAGVVSEASQLRRLITAGKAISDAAYAGEGNLPDVLAFADATLQAAVKTRAIDGEMAGDVAKRLYAELDARMTGTLRSVTTGFPALDHFTGGLTGEDTMVIAAAPGMGKSSLAAQIAEHVAFAYGPVALFALEMGSANTLRRVIASRAEVSVVDMRRGKLRGFDLDKIADAMSYVSQMPIKFFGSVPRKGVNDIRRLSRDMKRTMGLAMIIVDHPGYLREATSGRESKNDRLESAYLELSQAGKECAVPMLIVQHLNRAGMNRDVPTLTDLRGGGNLEGVANIVVFPHRSDPIGNPTLGEFIVAKNRDGESGVVPMTFDGVRFCWKEARGFAV